MSHLPANYLLVSKLSPSCDCLLLHWVLNHSNRCSQKYTWQFTHKSWITQIVLTKTIFSKTIIKLLLSKCQPWYQPTWKHLTTMQCQDSKKITLQLLLIKYFQSWKIVYASIYTHRPLFFLCSIIPPLILQPLSCY